MQLNELTLAGFVGRDPEDRLTPNGTRIVSFSLCHTIKGNDRNGGKDMSTWVKVKVFGTWCDSAADIRKGDNVYAKGRISLYEYKGKDGTPKASLEMLANVIGVFKKRESGAVAVEAADDPKFEEIPF